jgi:hypothetical protein
MTYFAIVNPGIGLLAFPVNPAGKKIPALVNAGIDFAVEVKVAPPTLCWLYSV